MPTAEMRLAARRLRAAPLYTTAVVLTLAVVVAANGAVFALVHAVLLSPLALRSPRDLVVVWESAPSRDLSVVEISHGNAARWTSGASSLTGTATMGSSLWPAVLRGRGEPVRVGLAAVSASFFDTLGSRPDHGRTFTADDDVPNAPAVAVLGHGAWLRLFGGDPAVIGTTVDLDGPRTIVGIMPRGFEMPRGTDFWIPVTPALAAVGNPGFDPFEQIGVLFVIGRLAPGATVARATAELEARARAGEGGPARRFGERIIVRSLLDYLFGPVRQALWAAWTAAGILLLLACANVSGLMVARATLRSNEQAVRAALGATRRQLRRQWYAEALVLSVIGGVVGVGLTWGMLRVVVALAPADVPRLASAAVGWRVPLVTSLVMVVAALACSVAPARLASRAGNGQLPSAMNRATAHRSARRTRSALVVAQIALAMVLLGTAGLITRSFVELRRLDLGFDPAGVVTMYVGAPTNAWMHQLLERARGSEQVVAAGAISLRPLELGPIGQEAPVLLDGQEDTPAIRRANPTLNHLVAAVGYFEAMRTPVLHGRTFTGADTETSLPVVVVGQSAARRLWPNRDAVGQRLRLPTSGGTEPTWCTVVGVVADVHYRGLGDVRLDVYQPALQAAGAANNVVVRTRAGPLQGVALVRAEAVRLGGSVVVDSVQTLDSALDRARAPWRFATAVLGAFAVAGLALAAVGLFGVVALDVTGRRRELAIRLALGARPAMVMRLLLAPAAWLAAVGVACGAAAAAGTVRVSRALWFGVAGTDPWTWSAVVAVVVAVTLAGAYLPARAMLAATPASLLRDE